MFTRTLTRLATTGLVAGALVAAPMPRRSRSRARRVRHRRQPVGRDDGQRVGQRHERDRRRSARPAEPIPAAPAAQPVPQPLMRPRTAAPAGTDGGVGQHGHGLPVGRRRHRRGRPARHRPRRAGLHGPRPAPGHARRRAGGVGVLALVLPGRRSLCGRRPAVRGAPRGRRRRLIALADGSAMEGRVPASVVAPRSVGRSASGPSSTGRAGGFCSASSARREADVMRPKLVAAREGAGVGGRPRDAFDLCPIDRGQRRSHGRRLRPSTAAAPPAPAPPPLAAPFTGARAVPGASRLAQRATTRERAASAGRRPSPPAGGTPRPAR